MAEVNFTVLVGATLGSAVAIDNVQQVSFNTGRQHQLDQYSAGTASITVRYPTGYASPNAAFVPGSFVSITMTGGGTTRQVWAGKIANIIADYGIPYASSVGNADYVVIQAEGGFAAFGRASGNNYAMASAIFNTQATRCNEQTGLQLDTSSGFGSNYLFPASTIGTSWGDWINSCVLTMNGRLVEFSASVLAVNAYYQLAASYLDFSDVPADWGMTANKYSSISFQGLADNYYTQVTVDPADYSAQTVQTGSAPYRTYTVNTLNSSTGQALDMANYLLSNYQTPRLAISSITVNMQSIGPPTGGYTLPFYGNQNVGTAVAVKFRGTTYNCIIEGSSWSGTPGNINATFYLSSALYNNFLLLDNVVYGTLDFNRLGY
jgi:hypothetical protein